MALKVIGTGFGRTGTNSLKVTLQHLGLGPCHHMYELRDNPDLMPFWQAVARGARPDWDKAFPGYSSSVDWPSVSYWREITAYYGDAKIIHLQRPDDAWIKSLHATIYPTLRDIESVEPGHHRDLLDFCRELTWDQGFGGRMGDVDHALSIYRTHNAKIRAAFTPDRMLIFEASDGWQPLCRFLDVAVPDIPFPHVNRSQEFQEGQEDASKWEKPT